MIRYELGVEDLASTRFAISPMEEVMCSLWVLHDPGRVAIHLPWRAAVLGRLDPADTRLLLTLVGDTLALPDFLTPRPATFETAFEDQLAVVRSTPLALVRRDILNTHAGGRFPEALDAVRHPDDGPVRDLLDSLCALLARYWDLALRPYWDRIRLALEADVTYRARRLATGGARLLFADMHPNLRWSDGVLHISRMLGRHHVTAAGRGLLLIPSVFTYKPVPPYSPDEPPSIAYPCRGAATLWHRDPGQDDPGLSALIGHPKARILHLLADPMTTGELARRLEVTPSAVSQHLRTLQATALVTSTRTGRHVLHHRTPLADQLTTHP
ncbi:ArsR/SmtB family transcription factor [Bailinhaonella thermotolerans]|uniref:Transcriptional regulator n=1 Tax=Bailinhaonella thermotolerans TaxID=1070861 RepID=A0A3A4AW14_9ACTN|nr:helix-turn-helix domain-containing protein [Bailinhaonella thermotolerans]RJL30063.1 transcriptional regulator [Bailinhaonella thermotolerans]